MNQKILQTMEKSDDPLEKVSILNHGFVELVEVLGSDQAIVNAARTSYDKGTKKVSSTRELIRYLLRHRHMGPFEFGECVFRIRCPLFVARQWFRHRMASYNEVSLRYSEAEDIYYTPRKEWITTQDSRNRQARTSTEIPIAEEILAQMEADDELLINHYKDYLKNGVAREIARINLPLSLYTTFCFKIDVRNLLNFLILRTDSHAQFEIRQYADAMEEIVEKYFPLVIEAWRDYHKNCITFSHDEIKIVRQLLLNRIDLSEELDKAFKAEDFGFGKLEQLEFLDKIKKLSGKEISLNYLKNQ